MKLTALLWMVACMHVCAKGLGQQVSLSEKNAPLKKIFTEIRRQTGYTFFVNESLLDKGSNVTVHVRNADLRTALDICFNGQPFIYAIVGNNIVIKEKTVPSSPSVLNAILNAVNMNNLTVADAPLPDIRGHVMDSAGKPMGNVNVTVKGTNTVTVTDDNGNFTLKNIDAKNAVLIFSYVGHGTEEIALNGKPYLNVVLKIKIQELEALSVVVNTGYQQINKTQYTGSTASIDGKDLVINGVSTLEQMLQGRLAGVQVVSNSGEVGTRQSVRVRGTSTLLGNQEPVWVVDGIIQEDPLPFKPSELTRFGADASAAEQMKNYIGSTISWLNPYDIDNITVLKDAAATAIYGVKAANGVIVITTKRGKTGTRASVSYNSNFSVQSKLNYDKLNLMNSQERVDVSREIWERGLTSFGSLPDVGYLGLLKQYLNKQIDYDAFNAGAKQLETNNTDWFDLLYRAPFSQQHSISVSGGGVAGTFYGSLGYTDNQGTEKGNGKKSYQGSLNFTSNISSKLFVSMKLAGNYSSTDGFYNVTPYSYATTISRVLPAYNADGSYAYYLNNGYRYNILNEIDNSGNTNDINTLNANIDVRYKLPAGFQFESIFGGSLSSSHAETYQSERTNAMTMTRGYEYGAYGPNDALYQQSRLPVGGLLNTQETRNYNYTWRNTVSYARSYKKNAFNAMGGLELRSNMYKGNNATQYGYMPDFGKVIVTPPATILNSVGATIANSLFSTTTAGTITDRKANYVSYFLTGGYAFDNRYNLSVSVRGDASNRFGQDKRNRFSPIWALGGRWNIAEEHFFDKSNWMNGLSLRASYGLQGNVSENYGPDLIARIPSGSAAINSYTGERVLNISTLPYADLRKEKTQTVNLGLDFAFFNNAIMGSVDYYVKHSKDLITMADVPYENGTASMPINAGNMTNRGLDVNLNFMPVHSKDFTWNLGFVFSRNFNQITSKLYPNPSWNNAKSGSYYVEGYPVSSFWVFDFHGLDSAGRPTFQWPSAADNPAVKTDATAYMKYAGHLNPNFTTGINTSVRYKDLTVSSNLYLSIGGKKILAPLYSSDMVNTTPNEYNNLSKDLVNRWRKPGDENTTDIPSLPDRTVKFVTLPTGTTTNDDINQVNVADVSPYTMYNYSTARVVNASYLRANNVTVNYTLPELWAKKIQGKRISIAYNVTNLFTIVSKGYKGKDAEVASGSQPLPRVHSFSVNVNF